MKKCRRLASKIMMCCLSCLLAFSTFFHFSSCAFASESVVVDETATFSEVSPADVEGWQFDITEDFPMSDEKLWGASEKFFTSSFDLVEQNLQDDAVYKVRVGFYASVRSNQIFQMYHTHIKYGGLSLNFFDRYTGSDVNGLYFSGTSDVVGYGREFKNNSLNFASFFVSDIQGGEVGYTISIDLDVSNVEVISLPSLFDDGYTQGYQNAMNQNGSGSEETFEVTKSFDIAFDNRTFNDANTLLPTVFEQEYDLDGIMNTNAFFYYATMPQFVFTPSKEYYGYKVELVPISVSYDANGMVEWVRPCVGSINDIYKGTSQMGRDLSLYSNYTANLWIDTAYSEEDIYFSFLCYFRENIKTSALKPEGGVGGSYLIRITPYTFDTYEQATIDAQNQNNQLTQQGNQIAQKTQDDINQNFDDLMNGYKNKQGEMASLDSASDSLVDMTSQSQGDLLGVFETSVDFEKLSGMDYLLSDWSSFGFLGAFQFISHLMTILFSGNIYIQITFYIILGISCLGLLIGISKYYSKNED